MRTYEDRIEYKAYLKSQINETDNNSLIIIVNYNYLYETEEFVRSLENNGFLIEVLYIDNLTGTIRCVKPTNRMVA